MTAHLPSGRKRQRMPNLSMPSADFLRRLPAPLSSFALFRSSSVRPLPPLSPTAFSASESTSLSTSSRSPGMLQRTCRRASRSLG